MLLFVILKLLMMDNLDWKLELKFVLVMVAVSENMKKAE